jgi:hypothetical protein
MSNQELVYEDIEQNQQPQEGETFSKNRTSGFDILSSIDLPNVERLTPEYLEAVMEIQTGVVSPKYIQQKQKLSYISHVHATETMNRVFKTDWDYQVLDYHIMEDGSALVRAQMQVIFGVMVRKFIEVGSHDGYRLKDDGGDLLWDISPTGETSYRLWTGMNEADRILSATSRTLLRCMLRAFNYGANLYDKEPNPPISPNAVWGELIRLGNIIGVDKDAQAKALKKGGITKETLLDKTQEAVKILYEQV